MFKYRQLFFLPSFYLLLTFSVAYFFYLINVISWECPPIELHFWCIFIILMSLNSVLNFNKYFKKNINDSLFKYNIQKNFLHNRNSYFILFIITSLGIIGIVKYILDYAKFAGALGILLNVFIEDTGQLRTMADNVESWGTQLSYFSWISAFVIIYHIANKHLSKSWFITIILIVFLNAVFLDRTRPVWIIFTCALCYFITTYYHYSRKSIVYAIVGIACFFVSIFIAIGTALGKGADDEYFLNYDLPRWSQSFFIYLTSSFAYLGRLISYDLPSSYTPIRITYPVQKIFAKLNLVEQPPNQILEFFSVPYLTNVGTFLEPFFQDGGRLFMAFGILLHTFIFDYIAYRLMKNINLFSIISIATLCFINFIGFFVSRINSTSTWFIFLFCFVLFALDKYNKKGFHNIN